MKSLWVKICVLEAHFHIKIAMVLSIDFEVAMALKEVLQAKGELKVRPKVQDFSIRRHRTVREASKLSLAL